jgi:hypothetical protein
MTRAELYLNKCNKELEKLNIQLTKAEVTYENKLAIAQKYGVDTWDNETHYNWLQSVPNNSGWLINKEDIKINTAWFDLFSAKSRVDELQSSIEKALKRLDKAQKDYDIECGKQAESALDDARSEIADKYLNTKLSQEEIKAMQEQMKAEWLKDGIVITKFYGSGLEGITPQGKNFYFYINNGFTNRSWHCYTLCIDGVTLFTSGTIQSCYRTIKNR